MQTDFIAISVGILGILIGIVVSYYFYKKSLRIKEPCWAIRSNNLIKDYSTKVDYLKILYKDTPIENLTISRVLFWNNGSETLDRLDLKTANPLRIVGNDYTKILDTTVLVSNNTSSQFKVLLNADENYALVDFDYLDGKQGAVIQAVHTGKSSQDIRVIGDIKGVKNLQNKFPTPKWAQLIIRARKKTKIPSKVVAGFAVLLGIGYVAMGILSIFWPANSPFIRQSMPRSTDSRLVQIFGLIFLSSSGLFVTALGMNLWRRLGIAPKGLEVFSNEFDSR